jgi:uncharacterized protein (TIGR03435 family)
MVSMRCASILLSAGLLCGQAQPQFEVASVRPSAPMQLGGGNDKGGGRSGGLPPSGGGIGCGLPRLTMDAGRVNFACISVADMIGYAYGVRPDQITGPDWLTDRGAQRFDVVAKLPQGASESQVPQMFQSLLIERFKLAIHRGSKEAPGYALVVDKSGLKLKPAAAGSEVAAPVPDTDPSVCPPQNFNCDPVIRNLGGVQTCVTPVTGQVRKLSNPRIGVATVTGLGPGKSKIEAPGTSLEGLADVLTYQVGPPVIDATAVKGRYEVLLDISVTLDLSGDPAAAAESAADRMLTGYQNALQKLGLRLEPRKAQVETVVIDRAEKNPTEN